LWFMLMMLLYWVEVYILLKKNTVTSVVISKEIGVEVRAE